MSAVLHLSIWQRLALSAQAAVQAWRQSAGQAPMATPPARPMADGGLQALLAHSPDLVVHLDAQGRLVGANDRGHERLGDSPWPSPRRWAAPGEWARWHREVRPALARRGIWVGETTLRWKGQRVPFALTALAQPDGRGGVGCVAVLRDLSQDQASAQQIARQNLILSAITEALPATVVIVDSQGRYRYVNSAFERYAGRPAAEILGRTAGEVLGADEVAIQHWCSTWISAGFDAYEALLAADPHRGRFSVGDQPSLAEVYLIPQIESARRFKVDLSRWPRISAIDAACAALPAFQQAAPLAQPDAS